MNRLTVLGKILAAIGIFSFLFISFAMFLDASGTLRRLWVIFILIALVFCVEWLACSRRARRVRERRAFVCSAAEHQEKERR